MRFQLISTKYKNGYNGPIVTLYGRDRDGNSIQRDITGFRPYFYILPRDIRGVKQFLGTFPGVTDVFEEFRYLPNGYQLERTEVLQVYTKQPSDVPNIRDSLKSRDDIVEIYEADIIYATARFLTDNDIWGMKWIEVIGNTVKPLHDVTDNAPLRILGLDIEVLPPANGVPIPERDQITIVSISFNDRETIVLVAKSGYSTSQIQYFPDEFWMLSTLIDIINDYDPDIIMSFNGNNFDFPYIEKRLELLGVANTIGRDRSSFQIKQFGTNKEVNVVGRACIDLLDAIKSNYSLSSYSLDNVSKTLLNRPKLDIKASEMRDIWLNGSDSKLQSFLEYARRDADLLQDIVKELKLIDRYINISKECGLLLHETINGGQSRRIESMLLREFYKEGRLWPLNEKNKILEKVDGGKVFEPERGLHENLIVMDYKSLYPSAIRAYNICWSSIINDTNIAIDTILAPNNVKYAAHGVYEGIMPKILTKLYNKRVELKTLMKSATDKNEKEFYDNQQYAVKILLNSFYGYTGAIRSRLYDPRLANSVTSAGRMAITLTKKTAEDLIDCRVVGGDSITSERFVTIKKSDGSIVIRNIELLFNEMASINGVVSSQEKEYAICNGRYFALSSNRVGDPAWNPIKCIMRHKNTKKIYRVVQKYGETRVTEDHSIMTCSFDGELLKTKPIELVVDGNSKKIAHINSHISHDNISVIDLYEYVKYYGYVVQYKKREKFVGFRLTNNGNKIAFGWTHRKREMTIDRYVSGKKLEGLCRLIGAFVSEGAASNHLTNSCGNAICSISCCDREWLEQLRDDYFNLVSGMNYPNILRGDKSIRNYKGHEYEDHTLSLRIGNQITCAFFSALCGQRSRNKRLPDFVFSLDPYYQRIIYDNMIKGDGSIDSRGKISYSSLSLELISGLTLLMNMLGKKYSLSYNQFKGYRLQEIRSHDDSQISTKVIEEQYDGYVYDLTVDNDHMFVDSCGQILLHNTDSVFIKLNNVSDPDNSKKCAEIIHDAMLKKLPPPMEIDFECFAKRAIIFEKKRYAMWIFEKSKDGWKDKIKYRGIEVRRRDWVSLVGESMDKIIHLILCEGKVDDAWKYTNDVILSVKHLIDIRTDLGLAEKLVLSRKIGDIDGYKNIQPHVTCYQKMKARGETLPGLGDRIRYMAIPGALRDGISSSVDTIEYIIATDGRIDNDWYIEKQILPPLERVFSAIGIDIMTGKKKVVESSLFDFKPMDLNTEKEKIVMQKKTGLFAWS